MTRATAGVRSIAQTRNARVPTTAAGPIHAGSVLGMSGRARMQSKPAPLANSETSEVGANLLRDGGDDVVIAASAGGVNGAGTGVPARCDHFKPCRSRSWLGREPK